MLCPKGLLVATFGSERPTLGKGGTYTPPLLARRPGEKWLTARTDQLTIPTPSHNWVMSIYDVRCPKLSFLDYIVKWFLRHIWTRRSTNIINLSVESHGIDLLTPHTAGDFPLPYITPSSIYMMFNQPGTCFTKLSTNCSILGAPLTSAATLDEQLLRAPSDRRTFILDFFNEEYKSEVFWRCINWRVCLLFLQCKVSISDSIKTVISWDELFCTFLFLDSISISVFEQVSLSAIFPISIIYRQKIFNLNVVCSHSFNRDVVLAIRIRKRMH